MSTDPNDTARSVNDFVNAARIAAPSLNVSPFYECAQWVEKISTEDAARLFCGLTADVLEGIARLALSLSRRVVCGSSSATVPL